MSRINLNEIVDPFGARVVVQVDDEGHAQDAWFDLVGLPRVDRLLVGQPVSQAPTVVERLCGICPAAHHLAGVRALDELGGFGRLSPVADAVRRLLHHGSVLETHALRLVDVDRDVAILLRRMGKAAMAAAGSPGHFPKTAVSGGVRAAVSGEAADALRPQVADAVAAARSVAEALIGASGVVADSFAGADVALVDADGRPALLGGWLRAVASDGVIVVEGAAPAEWPDLVAEERPGLVAPRPYLVELGPGAGKYRVGPVAQLRIGVPTTPLAAELRDRWIVSDRGARAARAIIALHAAEVIAELLSGDELVADDGLSVGPTMDAGRVGTGWVDGPRGLLVHSYTCDDEGILTTSRITTPTAQNEAWLGSLLVAAASLPEEDKPAGWEDSIREADPCLPVASAPVGEMGLTIDVIKAHDGSQEVR